MTTFTDQQLTSHLSTFAMSVFPVVFISTYLTAEATSCVAHAEEDRCESFVISQYVILVNTSCSYVCLGFCSAPDFAAAVRSD